MELLQPKNKDLRDLSELLETKKIPVTISMRPIILLISLKTGKNLTPRDPEMVLHNGHTLPTPHNMDLHSNKTHLLWEPR